MAERLVVCGGVAGVPGARDVLEMDVNAPEGTPQKVNLRLGDLCARMVQDVPAVLADLLEVASYVYCADQFTRRGRDGMRSMGAEWRRQFRFIIPVRRPDLWNRRDVIEALCETLGFLSEDAYAFEFVEHRSPATGLQPYLDLGHSADRGFVPDEVMLFSGGLDSFAGAVDCLIGSGRKVALVSHRGSSMVTSRQSALLVALRNRTQASQLFHVYVSVNKGQEESVEFTQRTRSFLFASLGLVVAHLFGQRTIRFYENGVVSINLPLAEHVLGARATRTTHPHVLADFTSLFSLLLGEAVLVENPYLWLTKSDVVGVIAKHGCADLIAETFSCTRVREATKRKRHCGVCSQCLDRRFGILGAGLGEYESADAYSVDLFKGERRPGTDVVMAESYVLNAMKLAGMSEQGFFSTFGQAFRVLPYLPGPPDEAAAKVYDLLRRHGQTVARVVDWELGNNASLTHTLGLPDTSLLMLLKSTSMRSMETVDPAEVEPPASEQAAADVSRRSANGLFFAVDEEKERILFRGGVKLAGAGFKLLRALVADFAADVAAGLPHEEHRLIKSDALAERLGIEEPTLRKRVVRTRNAIEKQFLDKLDVQIADDAVIQNVNWRGYRLNPYLLQIQPGQLGDIGSD